MARSLGRGFLVFLEIIGLRAARDGEGDARVSHFKLYHTEFRKLLTANNDFLEIIAELEQKRYEGDFFDQAYLRRKIARAVADIHLMVGGINTISSNRYASLQSVLDGITGQLASAIELPDSPADIELVLDMPSIRASHADIVGGKMANLGEIRNALELPTPDGFAVTIRACQLVFDTPGVKPLIEKGQTGFLSPTDLPQWSDDLRRAIRSAPIPEELESEMHAACDRLASRIGSEPRLAVRSSALGEDTSLSFAGQFLSVLNVPREGLRAAYRDVLASVFSPEAIHYRELHGVTSEAAVMAVGCLAMVESAVSGITFSRNPNRPEDANAIINAVRGLGVSVADGRTSPETLIVSRESVPRVLARRAGSQASLVTSRPDAGVEELPLPADTAGQQALTNEKAMVLARWAFGLEDHFGRAQDIEWAMGADHRLVLLQSRPLRVLEKAERSRARAEGEKILLSGGDAACPGIGAGPAVHLDEDGDFDSFPEGGVLVARRSSPRFVRLMSKASAIVTDAGSVTGHMANLARELRVPTILNTGSATRDIPQGAPVTVDADECCVYAGILENIIEERAQETLARPDAGHHRDTPLMKLFEKVSNLIIPLHLTNPRSARFTVEECRTLHDLARFIHERSYEEMFRMGETLGDMRESSYYLDVFLPVDLYIVDLGGGVIPPEKGRKVKLPSIVSVPLTAVLKGMLHHKIPRFGPKPIDAAGLFSLMMQHAMNSPENDRTFRDPSYALVSADYLNYTSRVGYHFSVVDSYCSESPNKNYINLLFRGGAADIVRRSRRAQAIGNVLKRNGFSVSVVRDAVTARLNKARREETAEGLEVIGRLLQFMRQMDVAMATDESARGIEDAFLRGDYGLEGKNRD
jgi:pyruvate,water dikinase